MVYTSISIIQIPSCAIQCFESLIATFIFFIIKPIKYSSFTYVAIRNIMSFFPLGFYVHSSLFCYHIADMLITLIKSQVFFCNLLIMNGAELLFSCVGLG